MVVNYYLVLGVPPDADIGQIKAAYRSMAKRFHPDTNKGSEAAAELFRQLHEAYRILADPKLRLAHDAELKAAAQAELKRKSSQPTPQRDKQKFNRFLGALLDALFEPAERAPPSSKARDRPKPKRPQRAPPAKKKPDFSFYYHLELEKRKGPYACGEDGVFRREKPRNRSSGPQKTGLTKPPRWG